MLFGCLIRWVERPGAQNFSTYKQSALPKREHYLCLGGAWHVFGVVDIYFGRVTKGRGATPLSKTARPAFISE